MSSLERLCSRRAASRISFSFRFHLFSGVRKKFFTTCWKIVGIRLGLHFVLLVPPSAASTSFVFRRRQRPLRRLRRGGLVVGKRDLQAFLRRARLLRTPARRQWRRLLPPFDADDGGGSGRIVAAAPGRRRLFFDVDQRAAGKIGGLGGRSHPVLEACNSGTPHVQRTCGLEDLQGCCASMWCVYLLRCADGTLYTGITNDL